MDRYFNKDFTLTLPDNKKITEIKWFAVYDLSSQNTFGDVYIPEEFEPPTTQKISRLTSHSHDVESETIEIIDAKTIKISQFTYNGEGKGKNLSYAFKFCPLTNTKVQGLPSVIDIQILKNNSIFIESKGSSLLLKSV